MTASSGGGVLFRGARFVLVFLVLSALWYGVDRAARFEVHAPGVVVITGATSGLGEDAAFRLARDGFHVLAGARSQKKADALAASAASSGVPADRFEAIVIDMGNPSDFVGAEAAARSAMASTGLPFTGLVNNAGVHPRQLRQETTLETWRELFEVNVFAPVALVEAFDGLLRESKGRVVNVGSVAGEVSTKNQGSFGAYSSSKFALRSANDAMRQEYQDAGVSVSLVAPGYVRSQMCDESVRAECGLLGPEETTTPAYVDALTSPRPRTKYLVAHVGDGLSAAMWIPIVTALPSRLLDAILGALGP